MISPPVIEAEPVSLCTFGVLSDVQYADVDDGHNFRGDRTRYFRGGLNLVSRAVNELSKPHHNVCLLLQLGDLIDGCCHRQHPRASSKALELVLEELHNFTKPVYHVWGNHEMYNFDRATLLKGELNSAQSVVQNPGHSSFPNAPLGANCYHVSPAAGFRLVILDEYEVGMLGYSESDAMYKEAEAMVKVYNKNQDLNEPWGTRGLQRRFVKFNGGISSQQLAWLEGVLQYAEKSGEKVIVAGHIPIYLASTEDERSLCWNYPQILNLLHQYSCVVAYFAGHDHMGGFATDGCGVHHVTVHAIVETAPHSDAFAAVQVCSDRLLIHGYGRIPSRELLYRHENRP